MKSGLGVFALLLNDTALALPFVWKQPGVAAATVLKLASRLVVEFLQPR